MDNIHKISFLLDFYGQMLTDKQYEVMDLHFNNDYSLAEIAQNLNISRQGVFDAIKKGKAQLMYMEDKLKLVEKFVHQKRIVEQVFDDLNKIDIDALNDINKKYILRIKENILHILDE